MSENTEIILANQLQRSVHADVEGGWRDDLDELIDHIEESSDAESHAEAIWRVRSLMDGLAKAAKTIGKECDELLIKALGPIGYARFDDQYVKPYTASASKQCVDPEGLRDWLGDRAFDVFNPNQARLGSMREIAEERDLDGDFALDTYYEVKNPKTALNVKSIDEAPKYAQKLRNGELVNAVDRLAAKKLPAGSKCGIHGDSTENGRCPTCDADPQNAKDWKLPA